MCRIVFYKGPPIRMSSLITEPTHSIIHQSYHSKERSEPLNGDGFGIGWYAPEATDQPVIFKDVTPAWNNMNLANLAPVVTSSCIVGHIRAATPGLPVAQLNCHPFSWRRFLFAHNGEIGGFQQIRRQIQAGLGDQAYEVIQGSTDSEYLFAVFIDEYSRVTDGPKLERMVSALERSIARVIALQYEFDIEESSYLNLILTDGDLTIVTRFINNANDEPNTLYLRTGSAYECVDGVCHMAEDLPNARAVLIASEPLSQDGGWQRVGANRMLLIGQELGVEERPMNFH